MSPEVAEHVDAMLTACADSHNAVDPRDIAEATFSICCWALSHCQPDDQAVLIPTFASAIVENVARLQRERETGRRENSPPASALN